jgi:hypothetical protein
MADVASLKDLQLANTTRPEYRIALAAPIVWMVFAAISIPIELRPHGRAALDWNIGIPDFAENILGFVPVGMVFAEFGLLRGVLLAAGISVFAETAQLWMMQRTSQPADVAANVIGGILGAIICARYGIRFPTLPINRMTSLVAAVLALLLAVDLSITSGGPLNTRGATTPGTLEAQWRFDENNGRIALDSSGHDLTGAFHGHPLRVPGLMGGAVQLDGVKDYVDFGHSTPLRLTGSMTITAWIRSTSFPRDDAAIVSQLEDNAGYQLDTTIDEGPRTIGFKLTNACGELMARYGATRLITGVWYHVAGVYDAQAKTMDVYLNGRPDNGVLLGPVTDSQRSSRLSVYVGRRPGETYEFAGSVEDVRIYSSALTKTEIVAVMSGKAIDSLPLRHGDRRPGGSHTGCVVRSVAEDGRMPGAIAAFGVLVAIACISLWPTAGRLLGLAIGFSAGLFFFATRASSLPSFNLWMMPLVSFAGAVSIALSIKSSAQEHTNNPRQSR